MNKNYRHFLIPVITGILFACVDNTSAQSPHSDVFFEYVDNQVVTYFQTGSDSVGSSEFPTSGNFQQISENPGFFSEALIDLGLLPNDIITYNILDNLTFWDGTSFTNPIAGTQIYIENTGNTPDTIVTTSSGTQLGDPVQGHNFIDRADSSGDLHTHIDFALEIDGSTATPTYGAYGMLMSLSTDRAGIADSDPFYLLFNFGLSTQDFDTAITEFEQLLVPSLLVGDFNGDDQVDAADFTLWRDNLGGNESILGSSGDGSGVIDTGDYNLWVLNYGASGSSSASASAVPEPSSLLLLSLTLLANFRARRN